MRKLHLYLECVETYEKNKDIQDSLKKYNESTTFWLNEITKELTSTESLEMVSIELLIEQGIRVPTFKYYAIELAWDFIFIFYHRGFVFSWNNLTKGFDFVLNEKGKFAYYCKDFGKYSKKMGINLKGNKYNPKKKKDKQKRKLRKFKTRR